MRQTPTRKVQLTASAKVAGRKPTGGKVYGRQKTAFSYMTLAVGLVAGLGLMSMVIAVGTSQFGARKPEVAARTARPGEYMAFSNNNLTFRVYRVRKLQENEYIGTYSADDLALFGLSPMGWHQQQNLGAQRLQSIGNHLNGL